MTESLSLSVRFDLAIMSFHFFSSLSVSCGSFVHLRAYLSMHVCASVHRNTQRGKGSVICFQQRSLLAERERRRPIVAKGMGKEATFAFRRERPCTKSPPSHHERVHHFLLFLCHECLWCLRASSISRSVSSTSITFESPRKNLADSTEASTYLSISLR